MKWLTSYYVFKKILAVKFLGGSSEPPKPPLPTGLLVLRLAHDIPLGGHLGITKTKDRILEQYYWPGVFRSVKQYCRTCEICQRAGSKKPPKAKLIPMPLIPKPFQRIAMDIVGPLPRTQKGNRYILVLCDYAM